MQVRNLIVQDIEPILPWKNLYSQELKWFENSFLVLYVELNK